MQRALLFAEVQPILATEFFNSGAKVLLFAEKRFIYEGKNDEKCKILQFSPISSGANEGMRLCVWQFEAHFLRFLYEQLHEWFALVLHLIVEYGILQRLFQCAHLA